MSGLSVGVGAAAGGFAGKALQSILNKQTPDIQKKFTSAIDEIRAERNLARRSWALWKSTLNQKTVVMTDGKYKTDGAMREAVYGNVQANEEKLSRSGQVPPVDPKLRDLYNKINDSAIEEFNKLTALEKNPDLKRIMQEIGGNTFNPAEVQSARLSEKIGNLFPDEYRVLKPFLDRDIKLRSQFTDVAFGDGLAHREAISQGINSVVDKIDEARKLNQLDLNRKLEAGSSRLRVAHTLISSGIYTTHSRGIKKAVFKTAREAVNEDKK